MKILKWIGIILILLVVIVFTVFKVLVGKAEARLSEVYDIEPISINLDADSAKLARGQHLLKAMCSECHGMDMAGMLFFDEPDLATVYTPNLTKGKGGLGTQYTSKDWVRAIVHGVNPQGRPLFIMPSKSLQKLSEYDLSSVVLAMENLPPVDTLLPPISYGTMGKVLIQLGAFGDVISAEVIDHSNIASYNKLEVAATEEYGNYIVDVFNCMECHGADLGGGKSPDPNAPPVPNITVGGNFGDWSQEAFIKTMRTGITPEGKTLENVYMPFATYAQLHDEELAALYKYLKVLPEVEDVKAN